MSHQHTIYGLQVNNRTATVNAVQSLLTEYGCHIRTRLGLHQTGDRACSDIGIILLEMADECEKCKELFMKLGAIKGVQVKEMRFEHA